MSCFALGGGKFTPVGRNRNEKCSLNDRNTIVRQDQIVKIKQADLFGKREASRRSNFGTRFLLKSPTSFNRMPGFDLCFQPRHNLRALRRELIRFMRILRKVVQPYRRRVPIVRNFIL